MTKHDKKIRFNFVKITAKVHNAYLSLKGVVLLSGLLTTIFTFAQCHLELES